MAQTENFSVLCERLRSERLLVNNEQTILQNLNSKVQSELSELYKLIWICRHERVALHRLINSDPSVSPDNSCQLMAAINSSKFLEGYKGLGHHITATCQILKYLLESPRAVAEFLNAAQKLDSDIPMDELNRAIFNLLYGSCVFPTDEKGMVDLLGHLISLQLVTNSDPRRLLRKGSSTFSQMYKFFSEELFSAKIFLTAALHEPVMFLLSQDELFLDIDPSKSPIRFPATERARRFGPDETSKLYKDRVARHRQVIVDKLVVIGNRFLKSIQNAMSCFPSSLTWLVRQLHTSLIEKKSHVTKEEAALICTDMIFTYFLCSAIINPEPLGIISDTPISHIARFNLIQVGQILQSLALLPYEQPASYMGELLNRFDQRVMPEIVRTILNSDSVSLESVFPNAVSDADGNEVYCRKACVGTLGEVNVIHFYLKSPALNEINDAPLRKNLSNMLKKMPMELQCLHNESGCLKGNGDIKQSDSSSFTASSPSRSNSSGKLRHLADKVQTKVSQSHQRFMHNSNSTSRIHQRITQSLSSNFQQMNDLFSDKTSDSPNSMVDPKDARAEVFILPLVDNDVPLGLASEEAIMQSFARMYSSRKHKDSQDTDKKNKVAFVAASGSVVSDRTTDVASDEEEAEGASSASCSSNDNPMANAEGEEDDEAEDISTLPDNFSDIDVVPISANVSGRGSPLSGERNSGRDTPFSGAAEQNDPLGAGSSFSNAPGVAIPVENRRNLPTLPVTVRKQNHEGLEEKFGKFGLPPAEPSKYRDETYSLVSDSWSTDVVASDNEGLSESRSEMPPMLALLQQPQHYFSGTRNMANPCIHPSATLLPPNNNFLQSTPTTSSTESPNKYYDPENLEQCKAFSDAKRKLR
uniref:Ras-GAP domain-containing protein n=1 Tax=Ditylenchus dipsaci TaxID=166011 RepID=A0A915DMY1_9BILA